MSEKPLCKARTWRGFHHVYCGKPATRGKYCGTHHPDAVAKRRAKSEERSQAKMAQWEREAAEKRRRILAAERWEFFEKHFHDTIDGSALHDWIGLNVLRYGGPGPALDEAMKQAAEWSERFEGERER